MEYKVFSITLDNASANNNLQDRLRDTLFTFNGLPCGGRFFHVRVIMRIFLIYLFKMACILQKTHYTKLEWVWNMWNGQKVKRITLKSMSNRLVLKVECTYVWMYLLGGISLIWCFKVLWNIGVNLIFWRCVLTIIRIVQRVEKRGKDLWIIATFLYHYHFDLPTCIFIKFKKLSLF